MTEKPSESENSACPTAAGITLVAFDAMALNSGDRKKLYPSLPPGRVAA